MRCESRSPVRSVVVGRRSSSLSPTRGALTRSATSRSTSAAAAAAVEAALDRRRRQLTELRGRVCCAEERATSLRQRADSADTERRHLQRHVDKMTEEREHMSVITEFKFLVHGQVTIIFVVSVGLSVCLFVQSFSQPSLI